MSGECVLNPEWHCNSCGECDLCDLNRKVKCVNCLQCVLSHENSRYISIDEVKIDEESRTGD